MKRNPTRILFLILPLIALAIWVDVSKQLQFPNPFKAGTYWIDRNVEIRLGLDLRGGLQVILEAILGEGETVTGDQMEVARAVIENRTNALGVAENLVQVAGETRIVGEFPGLNEADAQAVLAIIQQTGQLEFVNLGTTRLPEGTVIVTYTGDTPPEGVENAYQTIMTGTDLKAVGVDVDQLNQPAIAFTLTDQGAKIFAEYTSTHLGQILGIALDKQIISAPSVEVPITGGAGIIEGSFTIESANALAVQLRYGSLPVPLKVVDSRYIGPTLGEDSLQKSIIAGIIGMIIVILFMGIYYRMPGIVADISILAYAALTFAVFKYFHFTLTLPGIAGFLLSTGAALDANILFFERVKEELRGGLNLSNALVKGWKRAWSSIRDSNVATIITSVILFWFGSSFGATIVKGFSLTLFLGVAISLFTALFITRPLLTLAVDLFKPTNLKRWFGI
ncbi:MAG: preprotein translocase subunit SecD [Anaerolineaceae bacterium]|nr:MAG: preprotein translocase subunit SecD [Anaerolineaceae bacterium]